jgi:acetoin utilization protein AcuC
MSNRKLAFLYSAEIDRLHYPPDCPFKTERAGLARSQLRSLGLIGTADRFEVLPTMASLPDLEQFHSRRYLDELRRTADGELTLDGLSMGLGGPDTPVFPDAFAYGAWACGAGLKAADLLLSGEADIAFNLLGGFHHAMREKASGFCYLNDMVLACQRLAAAGKRVAYLDIDAHHGDGVQEAFYRRNDVLTISLHETGKTLFPWGGFEGETGEGPGLGYNVNVPLPPFTYDEAFLKALQAVALPVLTAYQPDALVLELGMDTLAGDPLTHLHMTNNIVVEVLNRLLQFNKPLLVGGGGGYHVANTVRGWALAWRTCCGESDDVAFSMGLGGVMLGSTEWAGGLCDRELPVSQEQRQAVDTELSPTIDRAIHQVFRHHGIGPCAVGCSGPVTSS